MGQSTQSTQSTSQCPLRPSETTAEETSVQVLFGFICFCFGNSAFVEDNLSNLFCLTISGCQDVAVRETAFLLCEHEELR